MSGKTIFTISDSEFKTDFIDPNGLESPLVYMRRVHPKLAKTKDGKGIIIHDHNFGPHLVLDGKGFPDLEYLNLADSSCDKITISGSFPKLQHLDISNCQLKSILFEQAQFPMLQQWYLRQNKLNSFEFAADCPHLKLLDLGENPFLESIRLDGAYPKLKYLYFYKKKEGDDDKKLNVPIQSFAFRSMPQLKVLDFENSQLQQLPDNFLDLDGLATLYLSGCALGYPESVIVEDERTSSLKQVRDYFLELGKGVVVNYRVKMMVVGNGRVGKTCLVKVLSGGECDPRQKTTEGIDLVIGELKKEDLPNVNKPELALKIWDFGGQQIYHATHQFFLSKDAIYLVVWTDSKIAKKYTERDDIPFDVRERSLGYWLDSIDRHAPNSPIIIVGTHMDDVELRDPIHSIQDEVLKKNHNLKSVEIDSISKTGFDSLKGSIASRINQLSHYGRDFPGTYQSVIDKILEEKKKGKKYITKSEYLDFCRKAKVNEDGVDTLTDLLVMGSYIVHFSERHDSDKLKNTIFIDLEWLTGEVYKLFNKGLESKNGEFDDKYLIKVFPWNEGYDEVKRLRFIDLLKKFDLIFQVDDFEQPYYIAPQYLSAYDSLEPKIKRVIAEAKKTLSSSFVLKYINFVPDNVIINFLSKYGPFSEKNYWLDGIFFHKAINEKKVGCLVELNNKKITVKTTDSTEGRELQNEICHKIADLSGKAKLLVSVDGREFVSWDKLMNYFRNLREMRVEKIGEQFVEGVGGELIKISSLQYLIDKKKEHVNTLTGLDAKKKEIKEYVEIDQIDKAFAKLKEYVPEKENDIVLKRNKWNEFKKDTDLLGSTPELEHNLNEIKLWILKMADNIKERPNDDLGVGASPTPKKADDDSAKPFSGLEDKADDDSKRWYQKWWVSRLGIALAVGLVLGYLLHKYAFFPFGDTSLVAFAFLAAFLLSRNPEKRYFRIARGILGGVGVINLLPFIDIGANGISKTGKWYFKLGIQDQPWITALLIVGAFFALVLDFKWRNRNL